jgi:hypothetical protein
VAAQMISAAVALTGATTAYNGAIVAPKAATRAMSPRMAFIDSL